MSYEDSRYGQLIDVIKEKQPRNIMEIGTSAGRTARIMLDNAKKATYYGFDLFDEATEETDKKEMNVKAHVPKEKVREKLEGFNAFLFQGNTKEVLPNFVRSTAPKMDVVFIDGGHSVETIQNDWENVKQVVRPGSVVIFDDYFVPEKPGFGCNKIIESISDHKTTVLPREDWVVNGGAVRMVRVDI